MEEKNYNKKQRGKSANFHNHNNVISPNKFNKPKKMNQITNIKQFNNKLLSKSKNERALSDKNIEKKILSNNSNNKKVNNDKVTNKGKKSNRAKSYNLIQRTLKKDNNTKTKKAAINNIQVNVNQINNIHLQKKVINISLNNPKNKIVNKNTNINKQKKPNTSYNAFKLQSKNSNKISNTEEKKGMIKNHPPKMFQKNNLFAPFPKKKSKNINPSSINNKNKHPSSAKPIVNKNEKNDNKNVVQQKPKTITKKNQSIDHKNNNPKQITEKKRLEIIDLFKKKLLFSKKKEKEKEKKDKNMNKNLNQKIDDNIKNKKKYPKNKIVNPKPKENIPVKQTQIKDYSEPTLIGLNNIGATCFINSTLQCLSQTEDLTNYFLNEKNKDKIINNNISLKNKKDLQLTPSYLELINKLWEKNKSMMKSYSPSNFISIINEMNPLFKLGEAGDSKDFIIFILEQIHTELKKPIQIKIKEPDPLNQYDKENAFNNFFKEFLSECSIISDTFFGIYETSNICLNCKANYNSKNLNNPICYNYGIFNCLIFPLEEVKNMKYNNLNQQNNNQINMNANNIVNIYDCFNYYQRNDLFTGDNKNYCNICKQLYDSIYSCKIYTSPNYLILILNRGKANIYNVKLDFPEIIDITQFVLKKETPNIIYNLYGVLTHIGQSGPNAHFVASCKSPVDGKWYRYNDALVNLITDVQKEIIDFGTPYILFYQKVREEK